MRYIYMNILRKDLINMYQIISLVYRKHINQAYRMVEGCRTLIVLYTLALLGFIFNDKPLFM